MIELRRSWVKRALAPTLASISMAPMLAGARAPEPIDLVHFNTAARESMDRTADVLERAQRFDQRGVLAALEPSDLSGFQLRLDERLDRVLLPHSKFTAEASDERVRKTISFGGNEATDARFVGDGTPPTIEDGKLVWSPRDGDDTLRTDGRLHVDPSTIGTIEVKARVDLARILNLGFSRFRAGERALEIGKRNVGHVEIDTIPDGRIRTYRIDTANLFDATIPSGRFLETLLLSSPTDPPGRIEIESIRLLGRAARYTGRAFGRSYEERGGETRPVLFQRTPGRLSFDVSLPRGRPTLEIGVARMDEDRPVTARVTIREGERESVVVRKKLERAGWRDARVDLGHWAGRSVRVDLDVEGDPGNVVYWSSPTIYGTPQKRLNVLLVLEDTLRADHLSFYGHHRTTSPVKDRLAERSTVFAHAFSQATKTRPSCPSLMTGLYPTATGVWQFHDALHDNYLTLAEVLRSQGFRTTAFLQNLNAGPAAGLHQGFDAIFDLGHVGTTTEKLYGDPVVDWLHRNRDRNFLLYLHALDPHGVYDPARPFDRFQREAETGGTPVDPDRRAFDAAWVEHPTVESRRRLYDGEILANDTRFDRILQTLRDLELYDDTLIVFVSDHGEHLGEHGLWSHQPPGFIQTLRVPLLLSHPGLVPEGMRIQAPVQLADVTPTILDLAGIDTSDMLHQGRSMVPLFTDPDQDRLAISEEVIRYTDRTKTAVYGSAFHRDHHFLRSWFPDTRTDVRIFDYRADPTETENVAPQTAPAFVSAVNDLLTTTKRDGVAIWSALTGRGTGTDEAVKYAPRVQDQLRALGYLD